MSNYRTNSNPKENHIQIETEDDKMHSFCSYLPSISMDTSYIFKNIQKKKVTFSIEQDIINVESYKLYNFKNSYNNEYVKYYMSVYNNNDEIFENDVDECLSFCLIM